MVWPFAACPIRIGNTPNSRHSFLDIPPARFEQLHIDRIHSQRRELEILLQRHDRTAHRLAAEALENLDQVSPLVGAKLGRAGFP